MAGKGQKGGGKTPGDGGAARDATAESFVVALTAAPDARIARRIAKKVVEERLAACVNIVGPVKSVFRWKGSVERVPEHLLIMKTTADCTPALGERIGELHPYETPEFVSLSVGGGLRSYLEWIMDSVGQPEPSDEDEAD